MSFVRPAAVLADDAADDREDGGEDKLLRTQYNAAPQLSLAAARQRLPIFAVRANLLYALETHESVVLVGATGSGKSTQLPQYLLESGWCEHEVSPLFLFVFLLFFSGC
jgi:ATP-dependent RNA helicase DDX35